MLILTATECYFYWFKNIFDIYALSLKESNIIDIMYFSGEFKVEYSNVFKGKKRILTE